MAKRITPSASETRSLRAKLSLSSSLLARLAGISESTLFGWETGAIHLDEAVLGRLARIVRLLDGFARILRPSFVAIWLEHPNEACKEQGAATPLVLFERGDYAAIEDLIYYLESGTPN